MGDATGTDEFPGFEECVRFVRSGNSGVSADGEFWLLSRADEFSSELISLAQSETDDFTRVTWIGLLGATRCREAVPVLLRMLVHSDQNARVYAVLSLEELAFPEGVAAAREYRRCHLSEFE